MSYWSKYNKLRLLLQSQAQDYEFPVVCYTSKYRLKVLITELKKCLSNLYTPSVLEKGKSSHAFYAKSFWGPHAFTTTQRRETTAFSTM